MQGILSVPFIWNGKDVRGQPEVAASARCWEMNGPNGEELELESFLLDDPLSGTANFDVDLAVGTHDFDFALVDDDGTTGPSVRFSFEWTDAGPSAATVGGVTFTPK